MILEVVKWNHSGSCFEFPPMVMNPEVQSLLCKESADFGVHV